MSGKNIVFTGSIGTGKSVLQMKSIDLLEGELRAKVSNNLQIKLLNAIDQKYKDYFQNSIEFDLSCAFSRRVEMLSIDPNYYIVSDEWALSELAKTMVRMKEIENKIKLSSQVLGPSGKPIMTDSHGDLIIAQSVFQILLNQVALEKDFWDFKYYVPIDEPKDDILNEEGLPPKEKLKQKEFDLAIQSLVQQLQLDMIVLPVDKEDAFNFLEAEQRKWKN
jgi:hypothetical protein